MTKATGCSFNPAAFIFIKLIVFKGHVMVMKHRWLSIWVMWWYIM